VAAQPQSEPAKTTEAAPQGAQFLDKILSVTKAAKTGTEARVKDALRTLVDEASQGIKVSKDAHATLTSRIAQLDAMISKQLSSVMHAPEFQKLEASWRGLHYLVDQSETGTMMKLRVLNATKRDLLKDVQRATEFDQSALFKKIYEAEYGVFGGQPYGALIGDFEFSNHPEDLELLEKISNVAASAHAPFLGAGDPAMFGLDSFTELEKPRDLAKIFESVEYARWKSFRESEDSRYVGLAMPHILLRLPYGKKTVRVDSFDFEEEVDGSDHAKYLWGNAAWAMAARLTDAFAKHEWCVAIRGVEGGGVVQGLPTHTFRTDEGEIALKCPTEIAITDRREKELADLGFVPLVHCKNTDYAAFFSVQSCQKPKEYNKAVATANARLSSQLQNILAVSRFAHYLKAIMRDKIGSFTSRETCEGFLKTWIAEYVLLNDNASQEAKAKHPLREAKIEVIDDPARPGCFQAICHLRPHFQLDELTMSLRLVSKLPAPAGA
jgi:type VI secretion system protein ImpC